MKSIFLLFLSTIVLHCKAQNTTCTGINAHKIVSPSAVGRWHLVRASEIGNSTEGKNTCGFFNTITPCKCIGINMNTTMAPPNVKQYTLQNFGYNERYNSYALTKLDIELISNSSLIFNAFVPLANVNFTIAIVGTDDYLSWMTIAMCNQLKDEKGKNIRLRWIITRSPVPTNTTIEEAMQSIAPNNQDLLTVNQSNCPPGF
ncbi:uncharacterized protein [Halyomorpha halys]|uniref:uncharacterized protein n=1 Tax=Halyomorpha halys TaxID=286706 RepID=UPI0006D4D355|nr:uncharacterized protein LOC106690552 [Halyomorpha halys]